MFKLRYWLLLPLILTFLFHVGSSVYYAYGGYGGAHCAGLLDAVWSCSWLEYYLDYLLNPFALFTLAFYLSAYMIIIVLTWTVIRAIKKAP